MKKNRILALVLMLCMLVSVAPMAAQAEEEATIDTSEFVTINMYMINEEPPRYEAILEEFNKLAREELNCELEVHFLGWGEYSTKYPLLFSSGEAIDMIYAAPWLDYSSLAQRGAFLALDDLLPIYCPESMEVEPDTALLQATVDGHIYALPSSYATFNASGPVVRGDLMEEFGITSIDSIDDYIDYLKAAAASDHQFTNPGSGNATELGFVSLYMSMAGLYPLGSGPNGVYYLDPDDPDHTVFAVHEWSGFKDMCYALKEDCDAGLWPTNILSITDSANTMFGQEISAGWLRNIDAYEEQYTQHPDWDIHWYNLVSEVNVLSYMQDAIAIPATAKNPERALMLLDKIRTDSRYYMLLAYGVEGVDYTLNEDNQVTMLNSDLMAGQPGTWGFRTEENMMYMAGGPTNYDEVRQSLIDAVVPNIFRSFNMNTEPIKNEYAAMQSVYSQYYLPLSVGVTTDVDADIEKLTKQADIAGNDICKAELQQQVDEFYAEYGEN